jgi:hypothetical protein
MLRRQGTGTVSHELQLATAESLADALGLGRKRSIDLVAWSKNKASAAAYEMIEQMEDIVFPPEYTFKESYGDVGEVKELFGSLVQLMKAIVDHDESLRAGILKEDMQLRARRMTTMLHSDHLKRGLGEYSCDGQNWVCSDQQSSTCSPPSSSLPQPAPMPGPTSKKSRRRVSFSSDLEKMGLLSDEQGSPSSVSTASPNAQYCSPGEKETATPLGGSEGGVAARTPTARFDLWSACEMCAGPTDLEAGTSGGGAGAGAGGATGGGASRGAETAGEAEGRDEEGGGAPYAELPRQEALERLSQRFSECRQSARLSASEGSTRSAFSPGGSSRAARWASTCQGGGGGGGNKSRKTVAECCCSCDDDLHEESVRVKRPREMDADRRALWRSVAERMTVPDRSSERNIGERSTTRTTERSTTTRRTSQRLSGVFSGGFKGFLSNVQSRIGWADTDRDDDSFTRRQRRANPRSSQKAGGGGLNSSVLAEHNLRQQQQPQAPTRWLAGALDA